MIDYAAATASDVEVLWEMLTHAASMDGPLEAAVAAARADAGLRLYVEGFGTRPGDSGVVARASGEPVGAAWFRLAGGEPAPFKVATATEPELAMGIRPGWRGRGIGGELLRRALGLVAESCSAAVLSVRSGNPAVRLYERQGFRVVSHVQNRVGGDSLVMRLELR